MFSKRSSDNQPSENMQTQDTNPVSLNSLETQIQELENMKNSDSEKSEIVNTFEKISGIISPYFIALIGLYLYDANSLIGTVLIGVGIISLLKISGKKVTEFIEEIKKTLGLND
jgi:hypothetical protein